MYIYDRSQFIKLLGHLEEMPGLPWFLPLSVLLRQDSTETSVGLTEPDYDRARLVLTQTCARGGFDFEVAMCLWALGVRARPALPLLARLAESDDPHVQAPALHAVAAAAPDLPETRLLLERLKSSAHDGVRLSAQEALNELPFSLAGHNLATKAVDLGMQALLEHRGSELGDDLARRASWLAAEWAVVTRVIMDYMLFQLAGPQVRGQIVDRLTTGLRQAIRRPFHRSYLDGATMLSRFDLVLNARIGEYGAALVSRKDQDFVADMLARDDDQLSESASHGEAGNSNSGKDAGVTPAELRDVLSAVPAARLIAPFLTHIDGNRMRDVAKSILESRHHNGQAYRGIAILAASLHPGGVQWKPPPVGIARPGWASDPDR